MKGTRPKVCVVGSFMTDLVFRVKRFPRPGESMPGEEFGLFLGGKGFNQAIACHRLGAEVTMVGRIGQDYFGDLFLQKMAAEGISADFVVRDAEVGTGVACPLVDSSGQNAIIGIARANLRLEMEQVERAQAAIAGADVLMLQFEVPPAVSLRAATIARAAGTLILFDPAPVHNIAGLSKEPIDYLVPNEIEAAELAGPKSIDLWAEEELAAGRRAVIVSVGADGAVVYDRNGRRQVPAFKVKVIDSTGAGDAFRAGLAVSFARGLEIDEAVRFANACGALACTVLGAEPAMPSQENVLAFLRKQEV